MSEYQGQHEGAPEEEPLVGDAPPKANVLLSNGAYDRFKQASLYVLPALAAAYFGIAQIWGLPYAEEVVGTVAVLETLLGVMLRVSNVQYDNSEDKYDGTIEVEPNPDEGYVGLNALRLSPEAVNLKDEVLVKVKRV